MTPEKPVDDVEVGKAYLFKQYAEGARRRGVVGAGAEQAGHYAHAVLDASKAAKLQ